MFCTELLQFVMFHFQRTMPVEFEGPSIRKPKEKGKKDKEKKQVG